MFFTNKFSHGVFHFRNVNWQILLHLEYNFPFLIFQVGTLILSLIGDFGKEGDNYFAERDNFFNTYFVKYSWGWTLLAVGPFMAVTGYATSCGQTQLLKAQVVRLVIATGIWYLHL